MANNGAKERKVIFVSKIGSRNQKDNAIAAEKRARSPIGDNTARQRNFPIRKFVIIILKILAIYRKIVV